MAGERRRQQIPETEDMQSSSFKRERAQGAQQGTRQRSRPVAHSRLWRGDREVKKHMQRGGGGFPLSDSPPPAHTAHAALQGGGVGG